MNLPIDVVVDLLMLQSNSVEDEGGVCHWIQVSEDGDVIQALSAGELREGIRDYLLTLVPKPKLLSECEEGKWFIDDEGEAVMRDGNHVLRASRENGEWSSFPAKDFKVIQPVEVQ